ncbi:hypothetical protein K2990_004735 [Escherichia coli]|nr:hypothetical protein [Escherichia coli]
MKELDALCKTLKEGRLKSKQAAFNLHYDDLCRAIGIYGWGNIANFINSCTEENLTVKTYKNMLDRAKKKVSAGNEKTAQPTKKAERQTDKAIEQHRPVQTHEAIDGVELKEYLKVCFNSESIAKRAIEAQVSIEQINEWDCPNQVRLGTMLSNYIRNK